MLALSVRQPWASAIITRGKPVENRSWPTGVRGLVLVHASSRRPTKSDIAEYEKVARWAVVEEPWGSHPCDALLGGFVGAVEIVDCVRAMDSPWFFGDYGFVLRNPRPLPFVPYKGSLGFFDIPEGIINLYRDHFKQEFAA